MYVRPESAADDLVVIKISPDELGRYGFNVKGGKDLELPVIV